MQWFGKPVPQNRFLGQVDSDDPTNLPMGLASLCKNCDFTRDSGGPTQATTRAGINTAMQCLAPMDPVTGLLGFVYTPESDTDLSFQLPLCFQPSIGSQYENPVGTGHMVRFPQTNFSEPKASHAIQVSAGNKVFSAYSDLKKPLSALSTMDPKALTLNPFGMKPFGFNWLPGIPVLEGEVCTPASPRTGNGHTYQAQNAGTTAADALAQPVWPLTEGGEVIDNPGPNQVVWKEKTMVIANRLPAPASPTLSLAGAGTIAANQDVYVVITLVNAAGQTLPSIPVFITTLAPASTVVVQLPALLELAGWIQSLGPAYIPTQAKVYVAIVAHGQPAPALSTYKLFGSSVLGLLVNVTGAGTGAAPPNVTTARVTPGQLPTPTTEPQIQRVPAGSLVAPPPVPQTELINGAGSAFHTGQIVYILFTLVNPNGETSPSPPVIGSPQGLPVHITADGQGIKVFIEDNYGPSVTDMNIYVWNGGADFPGNFPRLGTFPLGATPTILDHGSGPAVPLINTATLPSGTFAPGRDIYVAMTYTNNLGETPLGPPNSIINTNADDAVVVTVEEPLGPGNQQLFQIASVGIYEADVPTGTAAPASSAFALVGYFQPKAQPFILESATGPNPPIKNTTGPGGAIAADTSTGGANGGQGYRYAAMGWINQMETFSGFSLASVVKTDIDEDGWEIGAFNVLTGMPNVIGRYIAFSVADSSQAGPFNWIGLVNLFVPSQNVVYPNQTLIDQVEQSATVFLDNTTEQGLFNFTDTYLIAQNNVDDRLDITIPPTGVRVDYLDSVDRLAITGSPGLTSGVWISLGQDYESFYGDNSPVPIIANGERCFGVTDKYKGIIFALTEESGFTIDANTGNPNSWSVKRRWGGDVTEGVGPCGFRAWAACGKFIIFAHRSGLYKYDQSDPDMMQKEIPRLWSTINWAAGEKICVSIDADTHTVHVLVPTGASVTPNQDIVLSYIEGWNNPIHFSTFSGREISMDAARRWSYHDVSAFLCLRMKRTLPPGGNAYIDGPSWETMPDSSYQLTQLLFASSGPDGTVQARTPGIFQDNGAGIDCQYETMSSGLMQAVCKPEGFNLNAAGWGTLFASFIASREAISDEGGEVKLIEELDELPCEPIALRPKQVYGITRKVPPSVNEFWRLRFWNGKVAGNWFSLKFVTVYVIPFTPGRDAGDR